MRFSLIIFVVCLLAVAQKVSALVGPATRRSLSGRHSHTSTFGRGLMVAGARKIDAEAEAMSGGSDKTGKAAKKGKGGKKGKGQRSSKAVSAPQMQQAEAVQSSVVESVKVDNNVVDDGKKETVEQDIVAESLGEDEPKELWEKPAEGESIPLVFRSAADGEDEDDGEGDMGFELINSDDVLRSPPMKYGSPKGGDVPPAEVVFFGEPRRPPPIEALRDTRYHGPLLSWARHANVIPRTTEERAISVYPKPGASDLYLGDGALTYDQIFDKFVSVKDNLDASKNFILANVANVPPKLFLRALTAEKLNSQSKGDLERMAYLKEVRDAFILAHDQLYFPLNVELQKAETRVMTYVGRMEMFEAIENWDAVELSSFFTTLLAARLTWDGRVRDVLGQIENKVQDTVAYMADGIRSDLMTRTFKKPGQSSEIYRNATIAIQARMPEAYDAMLPEVKAVQETFFLVAEGRFDAAKDYIMNDFLPKNGLEKTAFMKGLRSYEAALGAMQGIDYIELRLMVNVIHELLCDGTEMKARDKWYADFKESPKAQFQTYETDEIPMMIKSEQRLRDTGSAFDNFLVQVLKQRTKYADALGGQRPKGADVGNWLERDPDWSVKQPGSVDERIDNFKAAYVKQTEKRKLEESVQLFKNPESE